MSVPVAEADGFQYRPDAIRERISARTKAIMVNSPANPTGAVLAADRLEAIAGLGPTLVSDEIYHGLTYEGRDRTALEFTDRAFVFNGFSKRFAMTGYRPDFAFLAKCGVTMNEVTQRPDLDSDTLESARKGLFLAGVIVAGVHTSEIFIENGRFHGNQIAEAIPADLEEAR